MRICLSMLPPACMCCCLQYGEEVVFTYENLEVSEAYIQQFMYANGPFDGILGFSQGGVMAAVMSALQRAGSALQSAPRLKFAVFFGSAMTTHPRHLEAMNDKVYA
jgi:ABC-type sugar transport system substrate-binding protein